MRSAMSIVVGLVLCAHAIAAAHLAGSDAMQALASTRRYTDNPFINPQLTRADAAEDDSQRQAAAAASMQPMKAAQRRHDDAAQPSTHKAVAAAAVASASVAPAAVGSASKGGIASGMSGANDLQTAAGHNHGHKHSHYYMHIEVPKKKAWKMGFKRGNHKHEIMKHEKGYKHKFHTHFKWHAKEKCKKKKHCKSVGEMKWEYKHAKKHHHHG